MKILRSLENMFNELMTASMEVFGSGWGWITVDKKNNKLRVFKTFNQDTPQYMGLKPLIAVDVWEHAHYVDYLNDRKKYIEKMLTVLNFDFIAKAIS